jgi:hypothetical protein
MDLASVRVARGTSFHALAHEALGVHLRKNERLGKTGIFGGAIDRFTVALAQTQQRDIVGQDVGVTLTSLRNGDPASAFAAKFVRSFSATPMSPSFAREARSVSDSVMMKRCKLSPPGRLKIWQMLLVPSCSITALCC